MNIFELLEIDPATPADKLRERAAEKRRYFADLAKVAPTRVLADLYSRRLSEIDRFLGQQLPAGAGAKPAPAARQEPVSPAVPELHNGFVLEAPGSGRTVRLETGLNIIGRAPRNAGHTIIVDDEFVSKNHAVLEVVSGADASVHLYDIGEISAQPSKNGVYVGDSSERLSGRVLLQDGDRVRFGQTTFVLRRFAETTPPRNPKGDSGADPRTMIIKAPYR